MGLNSVVVESAAGKMLREIVANPSVLDPLLAALAAHQDFCCLRFVDPYGDTIFNAVQVERLKEELDALSQIAATPNQLSVINELIGLASFSLLEPHRFMRFVGD